MSIIKSVRGFTPTVPKSCFMADNSVVVGDVVLGEHCTIWFNAVVRGDVNSIRIGKNTNIQDGAIIHGTYQQYGTVLGDHVSVGHAAVVHGCTVEDNVLIGMGAIVLDGARIGAGAVVAAGAVVLMGTEVEPGTIYAGVPAKKVKDVDEKLAALTRGTAQRYLMYAEWFR